jgi:16S rRNA (cytosine1402-N4)-methyltransferase
MGPATMIEPAFHTPVLVDEVIALLADTPAEGEILDGTVGGGGHAAAILERIEGSRVLAVDRDPDALTAAQEVLAPWQDRVRFLRARFDEGAKGAGLLGPSLRGALLDLGISSHQIDDASRGFTFRSDDVALDMRMSGGADGGPTAAELLNEIEEADLVRLLRRYGEEPRARRLARAVVERRAEAPLRTVGDLIGAMREAYGREPMAKERARVFQALRIEVNRELEALEAALPLLREALLPGGVLVVISYHSLEDRIVKNAFREWSRECVCPEGLPVCRCRGHALGETLTRRVVRPSDAELETNPRARSARLRGWRKAS